MPRTQTLRLVVVQYNDDTETILGAAGWSVDPDDHNYQDDLRRAGALKVMGLNPATIHSIRFVDVQIPITEDLVLGDDAVAVEA